MAIDQNNVHEAAKLWCDRRSAATHRYGHIAMWDVSKVTDMTGLFAQQKRFNDDISGWDVSNVESMHTMFADAVEFNQPLNVWNVSKVRNMNAMFQRTDIDGM